MPRAARAVIDGGYYHVLNRGNGRQVIFHKPQDHLAFLRVLAEALKRFSDVDLLAWCMMSNHWHMVLRPRRAAALAEFMRWIGVTHVRRYQEHYHQRGAGHLYQGRFKSFMIQSDEHLLAVCRYVEANPLRARLVRRAEKWPWSSLGYRLTVGDNADRPAIRCADWPIDRPSDWVERVNAPLPREQAEAIRTSIARDRPFGSDRWVAATTRRLGLLSTLRPRGRPKKTAGK
jgi:putative transposase